MEVAKVPSDLQQDVEVPLININDVAELIFKTFNENDYACTLRPVNKAFAARFRQFTRIRLSVTSPTSVFRERWGSETATRTLNLEKRRRLLTLTTLSGSLSNLKIAIEFSGLNLDLELQAAALQGGHLHICRWLQRRGLPLTRSLLGHADFRVHHEIFALLLEHAGGDISVSDKRSAATSAAHGGHSQLLRRFLPQLELSPHAGQQFDLCYVSELLEAAAEGCDLPTLQWLHNALLTAGEPQPPGQLNVPTPHRQLPDRQLAAVLAAAAGSTTPDWQDKVLWLRGSGSRSPGSCVATAAATAAAAVLPDAEQRLHWLHQRHFDMTQKALGAAVHAGRLEAVLYLLDDMEVRPDIAVLRAAASGCHLAVLQALDDRGYGTVLFGDEGLELVVRAGNAEVVAWIIAQRPGVLEGCGGAVSGGLLTAAAQSGCLELLRVLQQRGCVWTKNTFESGVGSGCVAAVEWLAENGCPMPDDGEPYLRAAGQGDIHMIQCLQRLGRPWGPGRQILNDCLEQMTNCAWFAPTLQALLDAGCPVDWAAAASVADEVREMYDDLRAPNLPWSIVLGDEDGQSDEGAGEVEVEVEDVPDLFTWVMRRWQELEDG